MHPSTKFLLVVLPCTVAMVMAKPPPETPGLDGRTFEFAADRVAEPPPVELPRDALDEKAYRKAVTVEKYTVRFSDLSKGVTVKQGGKTIEGRRTQIKKGVLHFNLTKGLFAGGRLVVWKGKDGYEAEYTIYGSGLPVISSSRGKLTQKEP